VPGTDNGSPALGLDEEGNASAAWVHTSSGPQYSVQATGLDVAGPAISDITFPATAEAGKVFAYGATLTDRWAPSTFGNWAFGDGSPGPLNGNKAYVSPGTYDAVLTATDPYGNKTTATRSITVSAPSGGGGGGTGGDGGGTGGGADTTAPAFLSAGVSNARFRVDAAGAAEPLAGAAAKRGTTFLYELSEAATVRFAIERRLPGRRVAGKCVKPTRSNQGKPRCARFRPVGAFTHASTAGANSKAFSGKLGTRRLKVGRYRVKLTAADAAGNKSAQNVLAIRVVRR
jgi:PKD repeat protein